MEFKLISNDRIDAWSIGIVTYVEFCSLDWNQDFDSIVVGTEKDAEKLSKYELQTRMFWFDKDFIRALNSCSTYRCQDLDRVKFERTIFVGAQFRNVMNSTLFALLGKSRVKNLINSHIDVVGNQALVEDMRENSKIQSLGGMVWVKDSSSRIYETLEGAIIKASQSLPFQ